MRDYRYEWDVLYLKCSTCGRYLTTDNYNKDRSKMFWFRTNCNDCRKVWRMSYYKINRDKIIEFWKKWAKNNKVKADWYKKKYRENNREKVAICQKNNRERHKKELWFSWDFFHNKANEYVKKHDLRPETCPICWSSKNIVMHHPSCKAFNDRKFIVFCCQSCHKLIHSWEIECPDAINLFNL
jgi:hypothetical protein